MKQKKAIVLLTLVMVGAFVGCKKKELIKYDAERLRIDNRYKKVICFEPLEVSIPLKEEGLFVRIDKPVEDIEKHQASLFKEIGFTPSKIVLTNPAEYGRLVFLKFADGNSCCFIWALKDPDDRFTRMRFEHEKYHALIRLAPEGVHLLSARLKKIGFDIDLSKQEEEFAASIVEILSLHLMGVPLEEISGSELVVDAKKILIENRIESISPAAE